MQKLCTNLLFCCNYVKRSREGDTEFKGEGLQQFYEDFAIHILKGDRLQDLKLLQEEHLWVPRQKNTQEERNGRQNKKQM